MKGKSKYIRNRNLIEFLFSRPGGIPARNHKGERLLLYLGIIDILQSYRIRKKLEHTFKAIIHDGVSNQKFFEGKEYDFTLNKYPNLNLISFIAM